MLFYDEFSGLIYQGKMINIQASKALIETPKKVFKVSLTNVKLLQKDQSLLKSEFFSRDEGDVGLRASGMSPHNVQFGLLKNLNNQPAFGIPKANDSQNLSSFLKGNPASQRDNKNDLSMPLFPPNPSALVESLQIVSQSDKLKASNDFPLIQSFPSKNLTNSNFQFMHSGPIVKNLPALKLDPSKNSSMKSLNKPFVSLNPTSLIQSQPQLQKLQSSLNSSHFVPKAEAPPGPETKQNRGQPASEKQGKPSVIDKDLVNFAILFKLLQKKKKLAEMHDRLVKTSSHSSLETNLEDLKWVKQSVTQIDKTLKNVWLSLKLRDRTITSKP